MLVAVSLASQGICSGDGSARAGSELVGTWVSDDVSLALTAEGTGYVVYDPPGPYPPCQTYIQDPTWPIKKWSLSGGRLKIKIQQVLDAQYDDGRAYRLHIKGRIHSSQIQLVFSDANHTKSILLDRREQPATMK